MSSLRRLPPEVRELIFGPAVANWDGKTPALIIALRPDCELYHEALKLFYRQNYFILRVANNFGFGDLSQNALNCITKVEARLMSLTDIYSPVNTFLCEVETSWLQNLSEIKTTFDPGHPDLITFYEERVIESFCLVLKRLEWGLDRKAKTLKVEKIVTGTTTSVHISWVWEADSISERPPHTT